MEEGILVFGGGAVGAFIGYLLRPAIPLYGQLPFEMVITRGEHLRGFQQLLIPYAQVSFNYMLVGAIIGAFIGWMISNNAKKDEREKSRKAFIARLKKEIK